MNLLTERVKNKRERKRALYFLKNRHERSRKDTIYKRSYQIE